MKEFLQLTKVFYLLKMLVLCSLVSSIQTGRVEKLTFDNGIENSESLKEPILSQSIPSFFSGNMNILDYVIAALIGLRADDYVPNTLDCAYNANNFTINVQQWETIWNQRSQPMNLDEWETIVFNGTGALSGYLPDAIYYCYFLPEKSSMAWQLHYESFDGINDFEGAFIQNIAGNYLTFIDIYNKTMIASENGDFITVIEQLSRLIRRLLDFKSMQRASLFSKSRILKAVDRLEYYALLMARAPYAQAKTKVQQSAPAVLNYTDSLSIGISIFTGFVDGSFQAGNVSACRQNMMLEAHIFELLHTAIVNDDANRTVYLATRALKHMNDSLFYCYYSGKETYTTMTEYLQINSAADIYYNLLYKTGQMTDQYRVIAAMFALGTPYNDR